MSAPPRIILHVDMNSYFATVEQQANPLLRGRPIVVGGSPATRTVVAAASVEAKKFGIKSGMSLHEALKLCPQVILVEGDQEKYTFMTGKLIAILERYTPLLEIFSIDEAFLDVTETHQRFGGAVAIALSIKQDMMKEMGDWMRCSIGIGPSKLVAKLASDMKKPDGLVVKEQKDVPAMLENMKLSDLCGIGDRMEQRLIRAGIDTMRKLRESPEPYLVKTFGIIGHVLHAMSLGQDSSPVLPYYLAPPVKSMGHHYTLNHDTLSMTAVKRVLMKLAERVGRRLRADHYAGKTITFTVRTHDLLFHSRQRTLGDYTDDGYRIYLEALAIMEGLAFEGRIRLLGVSVSSLVRNYRQLSLFPQERRNMELLHALDRLNDRYGEFTVQRAAIVETRLRKRIGGFHGVI
jgi:DNA polymerase IV